MSHAVVIKSRRLVLRVDAARDRFRRNAGVAAAPHERSSSSTTQRSSPRGVQAATQRARWQSQRAPAAEAADCGTWASPASR
jgi:hypothetical protein